MGVGRANSLAERMRPAEPKRAFTPGAFQRRAHRVPCEAMRPPTALALALAALTFAANPTRAQESSAVERIVLPPGPMATLVARLEARAFDPVAPPPAWPAWETAGEDDGWANERPWREWVELLRAEAAAADDDVGRPLRRARLALLAKLQGRGADAWDHLLECGEHPLTAAVLPALLPGVPIELLGAAGPLPPGVTLSPAVPPLTTDSRGNRRALGGRSMEHREVRIGDALMTLVVLIEGDGVQIDVIPRGGPAVDLRVLPPVPAGVDIGLLYSDWEKVATERAVVPFRLEPDMERFTIWARFLGRRDRWPSAGRALPSRVRMENELEVVVPPERANDARLARFAEALAELFDRPCTLRTTLDPPRATLLEPIAIHLGADDASGKLLGLLSMIEASVLARDGRASRADD